MQQMKFLFSISLTILLSSSLWAQKPKVENLQKFDAKTTHFGFSLGINTASFALHRNAFNTPFDTLASIDVVNQSGFNLGIVSELHLHKYFLLGGRKNLRKKVEKKRLNFFEFFLAKS